MWPNNEVASRLTFKNDTRWQAISNWPSADFYIQCAKAFFEYRFAGNYVVGGFGVNVGWHLNHLYKFQ